MRFLAPTSNDLPGLLAWLRQFVDDLNRFSPPPQAWPTFVDDAAAAAGNLNVGDPYVTPTGSMRRRVA